MSVLSFASLPLWQGISSKAGIDVTAPFVLDRDDCGFYRQTTPSEILSSVVSSYADPVYTHITAPPGASPWADRFGEMQAAFCDNHARKGGDILEIGAGSLFLAEKLRRSLRPRSYVVVDPMVRDGQKVAEILPTYFPARELDGRSFRTVLAFNSLEHAMDPGVFLAAIRDRLEPGGRALISIPDIGRCFSTHDLNVFLHEHISYFTPESFKALAHRTGLKAVHVHSDEDILWIVVEACDPRLVPAPGTAPFANIENGFIANLRAMSEAVRGRLATDRVVAFHGATNGLNNFLHLARLADTPNIVVFDGDESKAGRFLPACPNPIRAVDDPSYAALPALFVSAMTYFEAIRRHAINRHGLYQKNIFPLFQ